MLVLVALLIAYVLAGAVFAAAGYYQHTGELRGLYRLLAIRHGAWHAWVVLVAGAVAAVLTWPRSARQSWQKARR